jgi:hypothetical protein
MDRFFQYYGRWQGVQTRITGLPPWAMGLLVLAAIPGILLMVLSILGLLVSILALLLLTVPVYRLLRAVNRGFGSSDALRNVGAGSVVSRDASGNPHADVKIIEQAP